MKSRKIAVLIPEFPGQTHSFFWREIEALKRYYGIDSQIISTRVPVEPVYHEWVAQAQEIQLYPLEKVSLLSILGEASLRLPRLVLEADIRRLLRQPKAWGFFLIAIRLAQVCRARGIEHMHVHSCANFAIIAMLCYKITGIPYSLVLHGPLRDYGPEQLLKWKWAKFIFVITNKLYDEVSQVMPDMLEKVSIAPMGVDTDFFNPGSRGDISKGKAFTWLCCARLNRVKGYDTLIFAASILKEKLPGAAFKIRIAGEDEQGGTGYRVELANLIRNAGLQRDIELMGAVTQEEVRAGLQNADGFVLASRSEPLGVAYMEAMASELPVIGTDSGGVGELISNGKEGILVPPGDPQALAAAMMELMLNPEKCRTLGKNARIRVLRDFSSRRSAKCLAEKLSNN